MGSFGEILCVQGFCCSLVKKKKNRKIELMNKRNQFKYCNWSLVFVTIPLLATSILLECQYGESLGGISFRLNVILHLIFALLMALLVVFHLYLHFGFKQWRLRIQRLKRPVTKKLIYLGGAVAVSGVVALLGWLFSQQHSTLGGIHGKIGFVFIALSLGHTIKRISFFKK